MFTCACLATPNISTRATSTSLPLLSAFQVNYAFQVLSTTSFVLPTDGLQILRTAHTQISVAHGALLLTTNLLVFSP